jgi:AAA ATPase domain
VSLEALRIQNLRCVRDTGRIPIRPITILVGRNSSGKSTFLRAFPLLRQSVETATESPILWYHERYVDFGALSQAINHRAADRSVTFEFSVTLPESAGIALGTPVFDVAMTLAEGEPPQGPYVREYAVKCLDHTASLQFAPPGNLLSFDVNGDDVRRSDKEMSLGGTAYLLSTLRPGSHGKVTYQPVIQPLHLDPPMYREPDSEPPLLTTLCVALKTVLHGSTQVDALFGIGTELRIGDPKAMWQRFTEVIGGRHLNKDFEAKGPRSARFQNIANRTVAYLVPYILEAVDQQVADFMDRVAYLAPLRATAARFYRMQDLSVSDVDPDGKNLAMFIRSLSKEQFESFAAFTREHLGFESKIEVSGLQAEILVKEPSSDRHINLVDIGFGYTEVLPLMAILWSTCCREPTNGNKPASLLAIEQPELHLHPAHQAKLAAVIAAAWRTSRDANRGVKIMVETHSEGIINGLGDLIQDGVLAASDVQILFFDQDPETRETEIRITGYTEDGALKDTWPFGFFAPVVD